MVITKLMRAIGKKKAAPATGGSKAGSGIRAVIDYPRPGERITSRQYTFRVGVPGGAARVEVSINQGPWQPCRWSAGYWWYDWTGYAAGRCQAAARAEGRDGHLAASEPVKFTVAWEAGGKPAK